MASRIAALAETLGKGEGELARFAEVGDRIAQFLGMGKVEITTAQMQQQYLDPGVLGGSFDGTDRIAHGHRFVKSGEGKRIIGRRLGQTIGQVEGEHRGFRRLSGGHAWQAAPGKTHGQCEQDDECPDQGEYDDD